MSDRKWLSTAAIMVLILSIAIITVFITLYPVVQFINSDYTEQAGCPGDVLAYTLEIRVNRKATVYIASNHLRGHEPGGDAVVVGRLGNAATVINPWRWTVITDEDPSFVIPDLPPGDYTRALAAGEFGGFSRGSYLTFPYTIRDDCN